MKRIFGLVLCCVLLSGCTNYIVHKGKMYQLAASGEMRVLSGNRWLDVDENSVVARDARINGKSYREEADAASDLAQTQMAADTQARETRQATAAAAPPLAAQVIESPQGD